jgi:raffinose/stachyose/melibiose transport system substrate-binding protein
MRHHRFTVGTACVVMGLAALTAACGSSSGGGSSGRSASAAPSASASASSGGSKAAKIQFMFVSNNSVWAPVLSSLTKKFATQAPGSALAQQPIAQQNLNQIVQLKASQGALPLLYNTPANDLLQQLNKGGQVLDVQQELDKLGVGSDLLPGPAKVIKEVFGGKVNALPLEFNIEGFWFNKKVFAAHGLTPPSTWPELVADAGKLQAAGVQPLAASGLQGWPLTRLVGNYIFSSLGADAMQKVADGQAKLTDPSYVAAAKAVADLGAKGYFGKGVASLDYAPAESLFLTGKAAMFYMGSFAIPDFLNKANDKIGLSNIGFFPFPSVPGGAGPTPLIAEEAGQPTSVNAKEMTSADAQWLKFVAENYGDEALALKGQVSGFAVHNPPKSLPSQTQLTLQLIKTTKSPVLWFEALFGAKATTISQKDAAPLATGQMSPEQFMSNVQAALSS